MRVGTKSVLFGAHCFFIHPIFVAVGWSILFRFPWDLRLWAAFFLHDLGYWATYSPKTWTGRREKSTSISERTSWACFLAIGGLTSPFDIRATGLRGTAWAFQSCATPISSRSR